MQRETKEHPMSEQTPEQPETTTEVNIEGAEQVVVNTAEDGGGNDGDVVNED